jgi:hypothetical protein
VCDVVRQRPSGLIVPSPCREQRQPQLGLHILERQRAARPGHLRRIHRSRFAGERNSKTVTQRSDECIDIGVALDQPNPIAESKIDQLIGCARHLLNPGSSD